MEEDLGLHGNQYQTAVSILFVTYLLSELPSNLVLKKLRPSRWISFITTSWSVPFSLHYIRPLKTVIDHSGVSLLP